MPADGRAFVCRVALTGVLIAACNGPAASSSAPPVVSTPQVSLGTPIPTRTPTPTTSLILKEPKDVLLLLADAPAGFKLVADKQITIDDAVATAAQPEVVKQELLARGWQASWRREFTRDALFGLVSILSGATKYAAIEGARQGIALNVQANTTSGMSQVSLGETLGDESYGFQFDQKSGSVSGTSFLIYFRVANLSNQLAVTGVSGTLDVSQAIELARKQLGYIRV